MSLLFPDDDEKKQLNELALQLYAAMGYVGRPGFDFEASQHPQERLCYRLAQMSREFWVLKTENDE